MPTENSVTKPKRGQHPNSLANLRPPWTSENHPKPPGGETVTHSLKDILREFDAKKKNARIIAEKMVERAKILTGKSDALILTQLLERTEGKVPGDIPAGYQDNRTINIIVSSEKAKELTENVSRRLLPEKR